VLSEAIEANGEAMFRVLPERDQAAGLGGLDFWSDRLRGHGSRNDRG
jgi:hypothetical protein